VPAACASTSTNTATAPAKHEAVLVGCRVAGFVNNSTPTRSNTSQARDAGHIQPGDEIVGVDGVDCRSWEYGRVVELLKQKKNEGSGGGSEGKEEAGGKVITFRAAARSSAADDEDADGHMTAIDLHGPPSSGLFSPSNVKKKLREQQQRQERLPNSDDDEGPETPDFRRKLLCGNSAGGDPSAAGGAEETEVTTHQNQQGGRSGGVSGLLCDVVSHTASTVYTTLSTSASVADATVNKIGEVLVGHSEEDFQNAVASKMRLLQELTEMRAALGAAEGEMVSKVDALRKERDDAVKIRAVFEQALQTAQWEVDELRAAAEAAAAELAAAQSEGAEATARADELAAQREQMRAETEELRGHFEQKKREVSSELSAVLTQLSERTETIRMLREQIGRQEEELRVQRESAAATAQELAAARASAESHEMQLGAEQDARKEAKAMIEKMEAQVSDLEQSLATASEKADAERIEAEGQRNIDLSKKDDQISGLQDELQAALSAKSSLEDEVSHITSAHESDVEKIQEEVERFKSELQDRMSELQDKLQAAESAKASQEAEASRIIGEVEERNAELEAELEAVQEELQAALSAKASLENDGARSRPANESGRGKSSKGARRLFRAVVPRRLRTRRNKNKD